MFVALAALLTPFALLGRLLFGSRWIVEAWELGNAQPTLRRWQVEGWREAGEAVRRIAAAFAGSERSRQILDATAHVSRASTATRPRTRPLVLTSTVVLAVVLTAVVTYIKSRPQTTEEGQRRARLIGLKLTDLGPGWAVYDGRVDQARCLFGDLSRLTIHGDVESPYFLHGNTELAGSHVLIFATAAQARDAYRVLDPGRPSVTPKPRWYEDEESLRRPSAYRIINCVTFKVGRFDDEPVFSGRRVGFRRLGERSTAYQLVGGRGKLWRSVFYNLIVIQRERAVALLVFVDVLPNLHHGTKENVARQVAQRMAPGNATQLSRRARL